MALLDEMDTMDQMEWCRQWADLATRAGWPCTGSPSWTAWLTEVTQAEAFPLLLRRSEMSATTAGPPPVECDGWARIRDPPG